VDGGGRRQRYSLRLFDPNYTPSFTGPSQVYHADISGDQRAISTWIESNIGIFKTRFDVSKNSEIALLVRSTKSGELVDSALSVKHRFVRAHPLEEHFSLWARLFAKLLALHFNETVTAQEIVDEFGSRLLTPHEVRNVRKALKSFRGENLPELKDFVDTAMVLLPYARSESAIELLRGSLRDSDLAFSFAEPNDEEIQIMTLHKSKGMEFDIVFHLDLYEWVLPQKGPGPNNDWNRPVFSDWLQDVNLHYVGITRARKCCMLLSSHSRINSNGQTKEGTPSEFLAHNQLGVFRRNVQEVLQGT
jgi:ATP-dependent exoDNAse (exonuclease V) beta subunit